MPELPLSDDAMFHGRFYMGMVRGEGPTAKKDGFGGETILVAVVTDGTDAIKLTDEHIEEMCRKEPGLQYFKLGLNTKPPKPNCSWGELKANALAGVRRNYERYETKLAYGAPKIPIEDMGIICLDPPITYMDFACLALNHGVFRSAESHDFVSNFAKISPVTGDAISAPGGQVLSHPADDILAHSLQEVWGSGGQVPSRGGQDPADAQPAPPAAEDLTSQLVGGADETAQDLTCVAASSGQDATGSASGVEAAPAGHSSSATPEIDMLEEEVMNTMEMLEGSEDVVVIKLKEIIKRQKDKAKADKIRIMELVREKESLLLERTEMAKSLTKDLLGALTPPLTKSVTACVKPATEEIRSLKAKMEHMSKNMDEMKRVAALQAEAMKSLGSFAVAADHAWKLAKEHGGGGRAGCSGSGQPGRSVGGFQGFHSSVPMSHMSPGMHASGPMTNYASTMGGSQPSTFQAASFSGASTGGFEGSSPPTPTPSPGYQATSPPSARVHDSAPYFNYIESLRAQHSAMASMGQQGVTRVASGSIGLNTPQAKRYCERH